MKIKVTSNIASIDIKKQTDAFKERLEDEVAQMTDDIVIKATSRVPVNFGFLKDSIYKEQKGLNAEVGASAHYSPYVEFGTGGKVNVPQGLEDYAIQFKGNDIKQVNLPPRPFLFNSAFEEVQATLKRINGTK